MTRTAVLAALALLAACGPAVDRVEILPRQVFLEAAGATAALAATPRDPGGWPLDLPVRWSSSTPAVATVDAAGQVVARKTGEALVRAEAGGAVAEARVRVTIPARAKLEPAALELVGLPAQALLQLRLETEAGGDVSPRRTTWRSSDPLVARVEGGRVDAVGPGRATISAADGGLTAAAEVVVRLPAFARIALRPVRLTLAAGRSARLEAAAVDGGGAPVKGVPLAWSSSDPRVATVAPDGTVAAVRAGRAQLTAAGGGKSAAAAVTVRK